ncbi:MAG TPA: hypothetical protein VIX73_26750, partial [Kofleriaceae bacterium]
QAGEVWSCRTAADRGAFAAPEATVRAACDRGFAYACTTLAAKTSDAAQRAKACRLGDPAACFDGTSDPRQAEQGMAILDRNCEAGVAIDCVALGKRASGDVRARAARRAVEAAVQGCLAADLTACVLAQDATEPASDLEIRTMACALEPSNCQTLALRQFKANDIDGARRSYELSCLTDVRDYHYDWRASDCVAGAKLFRVVNDPARAAELMKKACALGNQHACGAAQ